MPSGRTTRSGSNGPHTSRTPSRGLSNTPARGVGVSPSAVRVHTRITSRSGSYSTYSSTPWRS